MDKQTLEFITEIKKLDKEKEELFNDISEDIMGKQYGRLTCIRTDYRKFKDTMMRTTPWEPIDIYVWVKCDCEKEVEFLVSYNDLISKNVVSCLCCKQNDDNVRYIENRVNSDRKKSLLALRNESSKVIGLDYDDMVLTNKNYSYIKNFKLICQCWCGALYSRSYTGNELQTKNCGCSDNIYTETILKMNKLIYNEIEPGIYEVEVDGEKMLIDKFIFHRFKFFVAKCTKPKSKDYIMISIKDKHVKFHRFIKNKIDRDDILDHFSQNKLDNTLRNLNDSNIPDNNLNVGATERSISDCAGIERTHKEGVYSVRIKDRISGKRLNIGNFADYNFARYARLTIEILSHAKLSVNKNLMIQLGMIKSYDDLPEKPAPIEVIMLEILKLKLEYNAKFETPFKGLQYRQSGKIQAYTYADTKGKDKMLGSVNPGEEDIAKLMILKHELQHIRSSKCQVYHMLEMGLIQSIDDLLDRNIDEEVINLNKMEGK